MFLTLRMVVYVSYTSCAGKLASQQRLHISLHHYAEQKPADKTSAHLLQSALQSKLFQTHFNDGESQADQCAVRSARNLVCCRTFWLDQQNEQCPCHTDMLAPGPKDKEPVVRVPGLPHIEPGLC